MREAHVSVRSLLFYLMRTSRAACYALHVHGFFTTTLQYFYFDLVDLV